MFFSGLICQVLLATAAFAIPTSSERFAQRVARRAAGAHKTSPNQPVPRSLVTDFSNTTNDQFSSNWAGAVLSSAAGTYKSVTGTFTVPVPQEPAGATGFHSASAWVGIDGDTCQTAILQTGIDVTVNNPGSVSYDAWFEWFPDFAHDFTGFVVQAGHVITASVVATSLNGGTATLINHSTGVGVTATFSNQPALCEQDAEWIVEDYSIGGLVPLANWGTVTFTDASAVNALGETVGPLGAGIIDLVQNGAVITSTSLGGSTVSVTYHGP